MEKSDQVEVSNTIKKYIDDNKIRQLFYGLTKHLAEVQPKDPICNSIINPRIFNLAFINI
jgi:hypothetical protein